jgi:hypothetical protein
MNKRGKGEYKKIRAIFIAEYHHALIGGAKFSGFLLSGNSSQDLYETI